MQAIQQWLTAEHSFAARPVRRVGANIGSLLELEVAT
jgi:hypothetical protein